MELDGIAFGGGASSVVPALSVHHSWIAIGAKGDVQPLESWKSWYIPSASPIGGSDDIHFTRSCSYFVTLRMRPSLTPI